MVSENVRKGKQLLEKWFHLTKNGTTVKTEVIAGLTTFMTMSYIIFVNPTILAKTGMDFGAVMVDKAVGPLVMAVNLQYAREKADSATLRQLSLWYDPSLVYSFPLVPKGTFLFCETRGHFYFALT